MKTSAILRELYDALLEVYVVSPFTQEMEAYNEIAGRVAFLADEFKQMGDWYGCKINKKSEVH